MVNLSLTNRHFGLSTGDDQLSLMEDVVRQVIINEQTEYEAAALPKYEDESYLQLYHQHKMLRKPLQFDQLVGKNLQYVVDGEEEDKTKVFVRPANNSTKTAISNNIMRAGKHYVEFTAESFPRNTCVGVMRPGKSALVLLFYHVNVCAQYVVLVIWLLYLIYICLCLNAFASRMY